jgi:hypothetical protein
MRGAQPRPMDTHVAASKSIGPRRSRGTVPLDGWTNRVEESCCFARDVRLQRRLDMHTFLIYLSLAQQRYAFATRGSCSRKVVALICCFPNKLMRDEGSGSRRYG